MVCLKNQIKNQERNKQKRNIGKEIRNSTNLFSFYPTIHVHTNLSNHTLKQIDVRSTTLTWSTNSFLTYITPPPKIKSTLYLIRVPSSINPNKNRKNCFFRVNYIFGPQIFRIFTILIPKKLSCNLLTFFIHVPSKMTILVIE